jgi:hypothetical protein
MMQQLTDLGYFGDRRRQKGALICCGVCVPGARFASSGWARVMLERCGSRAFSTRGT